MHCSSSALQFQRNCNSKIKSSSTYLKKAGHRFVRTSNLNLKESRLLAIAAFFWTLNFSLLRIIPSLGSTEYIFAFRSREDFTLVVSLRQDVLVWAGSTFKAILTAGRCSWIVAAGVYVRNLRNREDIAAVGANYIGQ
jgi:hypothetical protein